jgi:hypothetical protein
MHLDAVRVELLRKPDGLFDFLSGLSGVADDILSVGTDTERSGPAKNISTQIGPWLNFFRFAHLVDDSL